MRNFYLVAALTALCVVIGAMALSYFEGTGFGESVWKSFLSAQGKFIDAPDTIEGKFAASLLMLIGAGFTGILTAAAAAFFIDGNAEKAVSASPGVEAAGERLDDLSQNYTNERQDLPQFMDRD